MAVARSADHLSAICFDLICVSEFEHTRVTSADRENDLADVDTGNSAVGLAEGSTHAGLQSISACT